MRIYWRMLNMCGTTIFETMKSKFIDLKLRCQLCAYVWYVFVHLILMEFSRLLFEFKRNCSFKMICIPYRYCARDCTNIPLKFNIIPEMNTWNSHTHRDIYRKWSLHIELIPINRQYNQKPLHPPKIGCLPRIIRFFLAHTHTHTY